MMALVAGAAFVASCSSDDDDPTPGPTESLTALPGTLTFAFDATEAQDITVKANVAWTATSSEEWCTITPEEGTNDGTISVTVGAWDGAAKRTATITVKGDKLTKTVTVTQNAEQQVPGKATITGSDSGDGSVVLTAKATDADEYVWYNGDNVIEGQTTDKYTVTKTGTYKVAGKNAKGIGEESDPKTVTITIDPTGFEGTYNVTATNIAFKTNPTSNWKTTVTNTEQTTGPYLIYSIDELPRVNGEISTAGIWYPILYGEFSDDPGVNYYIIMSGMVLGNSETTIEYDGKTYSGHWVTHFGCVDAGSFFPLSGATALTSTANGGWEFKQVFDDNGKELKVGLFVAFYTKDANDEYTKYVVHETDMMADVVFTPTTRSANSVSEFTGYNGLRALNTTVVDASMRGFTKLTNNVIKF